MPLAGEILARQPVVVLIGPTAVGKTGCAIEIGKQLDAEIISADSRQVYQYMDIGTAKPTPAERAELPHHLIDIVPPDIRYTVADFVRDTTALIADIHGRGKLPMIVGGTGQFITAFKDGWSIPDIPPAPEIRAQLEADAKQFGWEGLFERLKALDPIYAEQVDRRNLRRVIRALEVCLSTGQPFSNFRAKNPPPYAFLELGLTLERATLYAQADQRVDKMLDMGLVAEVEHLIDRGCTWNLPAMTSLGYLQIGQYLRGELSQDAAIYQMKSATHEFIRKQYTWFRKYNAGALWVENQEGSANTLLDAIQRWLMELKQ